jgi:DNA-binding NtrC family response regulator
MTSKESRADQKLPRLRILVADDEESMRHFLQRALTRRHFEVECVESGEEALRAYRSRRHDLALLDLKMPGLSGHDVLVELRREDPELAVILMTGHGSIRSAVEAMREGAFDYITKPFETDELALQVERALERRRTIRENRELKSLLDTRPGFAGLIGQSPAMRHVYQTIELLQKSRATVLITGESGTGKELVARAIHLRSEPGGDFVPVHCAAIPGTLFESELFGHEPGAFTGATSMKRGLVERADGGTLFLDEISEVPTALQVKLLRFLQERTFRRVGETEERTVDLRVIAAANRDLAEEVAAGRLRDDLYFRLNVVPVHIPPLRERREDIPVLAAHFLEQQCAAREDSPRAFTREALIALTCHPWAGNVRELQNLVERVSILHAGREVLDTAHLPPLLDTGSSEGAGATDGDLGSFQSAQQRFERHYLERLLREAGGNVSRAARTAGLSRPSLHRKLNELGLDPDGFRGS